MTSTAVGTANPFPGPRAFTSDEKMFGRTRDADQLVRQLVAERIVLLYSPSGAGKTSLLRAKIRSMLEQEGFYVLPEISVGDELHDDHKGLVPNRYLASAISSLKEGLHQEAESFTVSEKFADTLAGVCANSDRGECVVFFDQFEQLVTKDLHDTTAKFEFMREVGEALQQRSIWALFAMREDYVAALDPYLHVIPTRLNSRFRLDFLTREGAREAIQQPPSAAGRPFAPAEENGQPVDPVSLLLDDLEGAVGPLQSGYIEPLHLPRRRRITRQRRRCASGLYRRRDQWRRRGLGRHRTQVEEVVRGRAHCRLNSETDTERAGGTSIERRRTHPGAPRHPPRQDLQQGPGHVARACSRPACRTGPGEQ